MNNNTKIRLHLSKNLFESIAKEVLAEAKVNDGYSVAVKVPKQAKKIKEVDAMVDTDKMKKVEETSAKPKHDVESLKKAKAKIEKRLAEMETNVAEDKIED